MPDRICDAKDCNKKATQELGRFRLCLDHYTSVAYDMIPLAMKGDGHD